MRFDARQFLTDKFTSPQGVVNLFASYAPGAVKLETCAKWFSRDSIPSQIFPAMLCLLELETGEPVRLAQYVRGVPHDDHQP